MRNSSVCKSKSERHFPKTGHKVMKDKKRYAVVGTGGRYIRFRDAMIGNHSENVELAALCDLNEGRLLDCPPSSNPQWGGIDILPLREPDTITVLLLRKDRRRGC